MCLTIPGTFLTECIYISVFTEFLADRYILIVLINHTTLGKHVVVKDITAYSYKYVNENILKKYILLINTKYTEKVYIH